LTAQRLTHLTADFEAMTGQVKARLRDYWDDKAEQNMGPIQPF
jgi:hypothetical protein